MVAPKLLALCRARRNLVELEIREVSSVALEELILNHGADLAIVQNATSSDQMCVRPILSEKLGLVTAPCHFQENEARPLRLTDLAGLPLILPTQQHANRTRLDKLAYQRGVRLEVTLETDSVSLAKALVRNGFGYTVLSRMAVQEELARGSLVFRDIEYPPLICRHGVAFRHDLAGAAIVAAASLIHETMASLVQAGAWPGIHEVHPCCQCGGWSLAEYRSHQSGRPTLPRATTAGSNEGSRGEGHQEVRHRFPFTGGDNDRRYLGRGLRLGNRGRRPRCPGPIHTRLGSGCGAVIKVVPANISPPPNGGTAT